MTRDESVYPDPNAFKPERFFKDDGTLNDDTVDYAFGFGRRYGSHLPFWHSINDTHHAHPPRRVCPGRHMADAMVRYNIPSFRQGL